MWSSLRPPTAILHGVGPRHIAPLGLDLVVELQENRTRSYTGRIAPCRERTGGLRVLTERPDPVGGLGRSRPCPRADFMRRWDQLIAMTNFKIREDTETWSRISMSDFATR